MTTILNQLTKKKILKGLALCLLAITLGCSTQRSVAPPVPPDSPSTTSYRLSDEQITALHTKVQSFNTLSTRFSPIDFLDKNSPYDCKDNDFPIGIKNKKVCMSQDEEVTDQTEKDTIRLKIRPELFSDVKKHLLTKEHNYTKYRIYISAKDDTTLGYRYEIKLKNNPNDHTIWNADEINSSSIQGLSDITTPWFSQSFGYDEDPSNDEDNNENPSNYVIYENTSNPISFLHEEIKTHQSTNVTLTIPIETATEGLVTLQSAPVPVNINQNNTFTFDLSTATNPIPLAQVTVTATYDMTHASPIFSTNVYRTDGGLDSIETAVPNPTP